MLNEDLVEKISNDFSIDVYWNDFEVLDYVRFVWFPF